MFATVGVPPITATAPSFTRILPAALRLMTIELLAASPETLNTPELNVAVVAALAGGLAATIAAAPSTTPPSSRRVARRQSLLRASFIVWAWRMMIPSSRDGARRPVRSMQGRVHAGDAAHHRLDVTFSTSRRGRQARFRRASRGSIGAVAAVRWRPRSDSNRRPSNDDRMPLICSIRPDHGGPPGQSPGSFRVAARCGVV